MIAARPDEISSPRRDLSRVDVLLVAMLIGILAVVVLGLRFADGAEDEALQARLDGDATSLTEHMSGAIHALAGNGAAMAGLLGSMGEDREAGARDRQWFQAFAGPLVADGQAALLAFAPSVPATELEAFEQRIRQQGNLEFTVFELVAGQAEDAAGRDAYVPVQYAEPFSPNALTVGFDLASDPIIRAAIDEARDSGAFSTTSQYVLPSGPLSLLIVPVYDGQLPETQDARHQQFVGVTVVGYRPQDLLDRLALDGLVPAGLGIVLRDAAAAPNAPPLASLPVTRGGAGPGGDAQGALPSPNGASPALVDNGVSSGTSEPRGTADAGPDGRSASASPVSDAHGVLAAGITARRDLTVNGDAPLYRIEFAPGAAYVESGRSSLSLVVIIIGLLMVVALAFGYGLLRRRSNLDLLGLADRLASVLRASPDAFIGLDHDGRIVEWSHHAQQLFGWTREEATGHALATLIGVDDPTPRRPDAGTGVGATPQADDERGVAALAQALVSPLGSRERRRIECDARTRSGAVIPVEIQVSDRRQPERWSLSCFIRDVTDRKQAEQQLLRARQMETVDNMARELTHDFNNLLTIVMGSLDLVGAEPALSPVGKRRLGTAMTAALRGADLTRSLMYVSRASRLDPIEIDVARLLGEVDPLVRQALGPEHELRLEIEEEPLAAFVDPGGLSNALLNLVINARDAMPGTGRLTIRATQQVGDELTPSGWVVIEVSDTGTGMPPDVLERAFEPFFTTKQLGKGTGLGLATVHGFVGRSGGDVTIGSVVGAGTTIRMRLPLAAPGSELAHETGAAPRARATGRILVVDDEDAVREMAVAWLTELGYDVDDESSGESALERLLQGDHALLVTDVVMSGSMDGLDLARRARQLVPDLGVVIVTGFAGRNAEAAAREAGFRVILKPYRRSELAHAVEDALQGRGDPRSPTGGELGSIGVAAP